MSNGVSDATQRETSSAGGRGSLTFDMSHLKLPKGVVDSSITSAQAYHDRPEQERGDQISGKARSAGTKRGAESREGRGTGWRRRTAVEADATVGDERDDMMEDHGPVVRQRVAKPHPAPPHDPCSDRHDRSHR